MIYYKVKSKKEVVYLYAKNNIFEYFKNIKILIYKELYTKKELEKILKNFKYYNFQCNEIKKDKLYYTKNEIIDKIFEKKEISKNKTIFVFGIRKEV